MKCDVAAKSNNAHGRSNDCIGQGPPAVTWQAFFVFKPWPPADCPVITTFHDSPEICYTSGHRLGFRKRFMPTICRQKSLGVTRSISLKGHSGMKKGTPTTAADAPGINWLEPGNNGDREPASTNWKLYRSEHAWCPLLGPIIAHHVPLVRPACSALEVESPDSPVQRATLERDIQQRPPYPIEPHPQSAALTGRDGSRSTAHRTVTGHKRANIGSSATCWSGGELLQ
ncbi:hypothetical protein QBC45DRAFT_53430 [Copromyces sp. CBS 386.78]|nr:hypothetical protein QBC45DRAFT_53430 [Copromyces sp. CBS 386.78]